MAVDNLNNSIFQPFVFLRIKDDYPLADAKRNFLKFPNGCDDCKDYVEESFHDKCQELFGSYANPLLMIYLNIQSA